MEIRAGAGGVTETDGRLAGGGSDLASSKAAAMDNARIRRTAIRLELQSAPRWMWRYRHRLRQQLGCVAPGAEGRERLGNEHLRQAPVWRHLEPLKVASLTLAAEAPAFKRAEADRQRWLKQRDQNGTEPKPRRHWKLSASGHSSTTMISPESDPVVGAGSAFTRKRN